MINSTDLWKEANLAYLSRTFYFLLTSMCYLIAFEAFTMVSVGDKCLLQSWMGKGCNFARVFVFCVYHTAHR